MGAIQQQLMSYNSAPANYILTQVPGAVAGLSLRKLIASATVAIRVRRASDNTEQDIGFSGDNLDTTALLLFCAATNGFVTMFYDQSGNSNHLIMTTASNQPQIVTGGVITTTDGANLKPAVQFTNSSDHYMTLPTGFWNGATAISFITSWNIDTSASPNGGVFAPSSASGVGFELVSNDGGSNKFRLNGTDRGATSASLFPDDTHIVTEVYGDGSSVAVYTNNSTVTLSNSSAMPALNFNGLYSLARYAGSGGNDTTLKFQEMILYSTNKTANRSTIYSNLSTYYG